MLWCPNKFKDYHPIYKTFFEREISKTLARDIAVHLQKQINEYDPFTPIDERDVCLRADLLDCLAYVSSNIGGDICH